MKSVATILAFGLATAVVAQEQCASLVAQIPSCATQCIDKAASGVGCTSPTDLACQCKNTDAINAAALNCVLSGCGAQKGLAVQSAASAICDCVASAGSSPSTTEAAASSPATTSAVPTAPGPEVSAASSAVLTPSSAPYPTASQISDGQVQASGAASASASAPANTTVPFTGDGIKIAASAASIIFAIAAAMVAL